MKKQTVKTTSDKKDNGEALSGKSLDAIALLKADHRQVKTLFKKFENTESDEEKKQIADQICKELIVHTTIEEELFYPICRQNGVDIDDLDEAQIEHDSAKVLIQKLIDCQTDDPYYDATVKVLSEYIQHHVDEEEKPNSGIFAKAKKHGIDLEELGKKLKERKEQLQEENVPLSSQLKIVALKQSLGKENNTMAKRYNDDYEDDNEQGKYYQQSQRENREQYGRFRSEDNNRSRSGRGSYEQDDGSQSYSYRGSSGSRYQGEDENGGRSRGRTPSRESQNYSGGSSGRGQQGQSRYSGRYEDDGYQYGSSSRSGGSQGQRGWSGGSEGNSEAAQEWENSGRYGRTNYEDNDDNDNRRYSSRTSYERSSQDRDERGSSRGGGSQGGWFGGSEDHPESTRGSRRNR